MPNSASQPILQQIPNWQNYENEFHYSVSGTYATLNNPSGDVFDYQISSLTHENYFTWISACQSSNTTTCTNGSWTYGPNLGVQVLLLECLMLGLTTLPLHHQLQTRLLGI